MRYLVAGFIGVIAFWLFWTGCMAIGALVELYDRYGPENISDNTKLAVGWSFISFLLGIAAYWGFYA